MTFEKYTFGILALLYLCYLARLLVREEFLLFLRQSMLGVPGFIAHGVILLFDEKAFFAYHMQIAQTLPVTREALAMTLLALLSSHCGFRLARNRTLKSEVNAGSQLLSSRWQVQTTRWLAYMFVIAAALYLSSTTVPIWEEVYGANVVAEPLLRNLNAMLSIGLSLILACNLAAWRLGERSIPQSVLFVLSLLYVAIWCMWLRGNRMDAYNILICLGVTALAFRKLTPLRRSTKLRVACLALVLLLLGQAWGYIRSREQLSLSQLSLNESLRVADASSDVPLTLTTIGDVCATFTGTLYFLDRGLLEFRWGAGYLNYIPRSVPGFLWRDRPEDEAWLFSQALGETSGGGFFELAEAYYNLGWAGVLLVPFALSACFSRLYYMCVVRGTLFDFFCLWGIAGVWWRGAWYQTFAYWRGFTTAAVMYILVALVLILIERARVVSFR